MSDELSVNSESSEEITNASNKASTEVSVNLENMEVDVSKKIVDAICIIASSTESYSTTTNKLNVPGTSIDEVMAELQKLEAITTDHELFARCCRLMMFKPAREMFVALKDSDQTLLLHWLKFSAYNPFPFKIT
jgi:hypothetical protein